MATNVFVVTGNLGTQPVIGESKGRAFGSFNLAHHERFKRGDAPATHTNWFRVVAFGNRTNALEQLGKGDQVTVTGRIRVNVRIGKGGLKVQVVEVHADRIDYLRVSGRRDSGDDVDRASESGGELLDAEPPALPESPVPFDDERPL